MEVADILGMTLVELEAALNGQPAAPAGESLQDWAANFSDLDFRQLCQLQEGDRLVRWISIAAQALASKNTEDSPRCRIAAGRASPKSLQGITAPSTGRCRSR